MTRKDQVTETPTLEEVLSSWLGLTAAAKAAGVAERTMAYMVARGKMRSIQTPIGRLIEPTQIVTYAREHRERFQMDGYMTRRERMNSKLVREIEQALPRDATACHDRKVGSDPPSITSALDADTTKSAGERR